MNILDEKILEVIKRIEEKEEIFTWTISENINNSSNEMIKPRQSHPRSVTRQIGELLNLLILSTKSKKILELGCSAGYSSLWMSLAITKTRGHIYTTEIYKEKIKTALENFRDAGVESMITLIEGDIKNTLKNWKINNLDFVFIDANKEEYINYYDLVFNNLRTGGIIIADNIYSHYEDLEEFIKKVEGDSRVISCKLKIDSGLLLIYKK